jgi:hypothetical protein
MHRSLVDYDVFATVSDVTLITRTQRVEQAIAETVCAAARDFQ